jgi:hypothetical protein
MRCLLSDSAIILWCRIIPSTKVASEGSTVAPRGSHGTGGTPTLNAGPVVPGDGKTC